MRPSDNFNSVLKHIMTSLSESSCLIIVCIIQYDYKQSHLLSVIKACHFLWVILDSPVRSTLFTLDRQNSNQVSENSCAEAVPSTPPSEVVWSE